MEIGSQQEREKMEIGSQYERERMEIGSYIVVGERVMDRKRIEREEEL